MPTTSIAHPNQRQQVIAVVEQERRAMCSGDCDLYFSVLAEDAIYFPPNAPAKQGAELRAWLADFLNHFSVEWLRWEEGEVIVAGNIAYHDYAYRMKSTPKTGGEAVIGTGKGLGVFRCEPDGSWKVVRHMWNAAPEEE